MERQLFDALQQKILTHQAVEYTIAGFRRELSNRDTRLQGQLAGLRKRAGVLEIELARFAATIGAGGKMRALLAAMAERERELER